MIFEKKLVKKFLLLVSAFAVVARVALEGISALAKTSGKTIVKKTRPSQQASVACGWAGAVKGGRQGRWGVTYTREYQSHAIGQEW